MADTASVVCMVCVCWSEGRNLFSCVTLQLSVEQEPHILRPLWSTALNVKRKFQKKKKKKTIASQGITSFTPNIFVFLRHDLLSSGLALNSPRIEDDRDPLSLLLLSSRC